MQWTKKLLIDQVFAELGLPVYTFDIQPEQRQSVLVSMESLVAHWESKSIWLQYDYGVDESADSGISDQSALGLIANVAVRVAPQFGKTLPAETLAMATEAYENFAAAAAMPLPSQMPGTMPRGAGHKYWRGWQRPFLKAPDAGSIVNYPNITDITIKRD